MTDVYVPAELYFYVTEESQLVNVYILDNEWWVFHPIEL